MSTKNPTYGYGINEGAVKPKRKKKQFTCNINDKVTFELTPYGLALLEKRKYEPLKEMREEQVACGFITRQMHEVMFLLGQSMYNGGPQVIVKNQITFVI